MVGRRHTRNLVRKFKPSMVILVETHCSFANAESFWKGLGYEIAGLTEAQGHSGGIWVLVEIVRNFGVTVVEVFHQAITTSISRGNKSWTCTAIYASPVLAVRELLWSHLENTRSATVNPWMLLGDFNEILLPSEVRGGFFPQNRALKFSDMMERCGLMDLGSTGGKFTWFRKVEGSRAVSKLLDRAIADYEWRTSFSEAFVENLLRQYSDHSPLLLRCKGEVAPKYSRNFHFQAAWLNHSDYKSVVQLAWEKGIHSVSNKLDSVRKDSLTFNSEVFGNIFWKKRTLEARLRGIHKTLETCDILGLLILEVDLQKEYNDVLHQEELLWFQKSRERWVRFGDRNTKFFHTQTIVRRKRNKVHGLFLNNGEWCTDANILEGEVLDFYKKTFHF